jgi:hypothetical protein
MSEQTNVSLVRFVPTEAVPIYPRENIRLGDVPVGHLVEFDNALQYVWNHKRGSEITTLLHYTGDVGFPWTKDHVVTDYGPVEKITPDGESGWRFRLLNPPTPPTVRLEDVRMLSVVRFPDGEVGVRMVGLTANGLTGVLVAFDDAPRMVPGDTIVTDLGSIKIGGGK